MVNGRFDLSPYCQAGLIDSVSKVTSIQFALSTIFRPAARIVWRSLWYDDLSANVGAMLGALLSNQPVTDVQLRRKTRQTQEQLQKGTISVRTIGRRVAQFAFVGIPLACAVGLLFGIVNWLQSLFNCILTFVTICLQMYRNANDDVGYYYQHPEELPDRKQAIDSVTTQIVAPYVSKLVAAKIPFVGPRVAPKIQIFLGQRASDRINKVYDKIEAKLYKQKQARHVS